GAQLQLLHVRALLQVPHMERVAVLPGQEQLRVHALAYHVRRAPLAGDHRVVAEVPPDDGPLRGGPAARRTHSRRALRSARQPESRAARARAGMGAVPRGSAGISRRERRAAGGDMRAAEMDNAAPFACDMSALTPEQRIEHARVARELFG